LRRWLLRALQLDPRGCFRSMADAQEGLEHVLSEEGGYIAAPMALETFLVRYHERAVLSVPSPTARPSQPASPAGEGARPTPTPTGSATRPAQRPPPAPIHGRTRCAGRVRRRRHWGSRVHLDA
jgi:hypothetical protein